LIVATYYYGFEVSMMMTMMMMMMRDASDLMWAMKRLWELMLLRLIERTLSDC
jgi:hypothetical protein